MLTVFLGTGDALFLPEIYAIELTRDGMITILSSGNCDLSTGLRSLFALSSSFFLSSVPYAFLLRVFCVFFASSAWQLHNDKNPGLSEGQTTMTSLQLKRTTVQNKTKQFTFRVLALFFETMKPLQFAELQRHRISVVSFKEGSQVTILCE